MVFLLSPLTHTLPLLVAATAAATKKHDVTIHFGWTLQPVLALVAGLLILVMPRILNYVVAAYLIAVGVIGIFGLPW